MLRPKLITSILIFLWVSLFHYESLRHPFLQPLLKQSLPSVPVLYPALGWNMFYKLSNDWMGVEVYGLKADQPPQAIDLHQIFQVRFPGYEPLRRNIATPALFAPHSKAEFCRFIRHKLPGYDSFVISLTGFNPLTPERSVKQYLPRGYPC